MKSAPMIVLTAALALAGIAPAAAQDDIRSTEEIVITATRTPHGLEEIPGAVTVIDSEEIRRSGSPDIKSVLEQVPSLFINDTGLSGGGVASILLRGSRSTQVLVLLDGLRLANAQSSFFNLNDLPVPRERIERIEILPVPASALYGADALGGVINIITRRPEKSTSLSLSQGGGSYGGRRSAASANWGKEGFGVSVDGLMRSGDGHRDNGDFDLEKVAVGTRYYGSVAELDLGWDYLRRDTGSPGSVAFPSLLARQEDEAHYFRLGASVWPGDAWEFKGALFHDRQRRDFTNPEFGIDSTHKNKKGGVDGQGTFDGGRWGLLTAGGEWIADDIDSTDAGRHDTSRWAIFLQEELPLGPLAITLTGRVDDHSVYGTEFNPRIAVLAALPSAGRVWVNASRGFRAPNFDDLFWTGSFGAGNPDLKPETSWNYEAGMAKEWRNGSRARLSVFQRDVEDLIEWGDPDGDFVFSPDNISSARFRGVEFDGALRLFPWLEVPVGYQYLDAEDRDSGDDIAGRVRHQFRGALRATGGPVSASLEGAWTEHVDTPAKTDWDYAVFSGACRWSGTAGPYPLALSVRVENLFDEEFEKIEGFPMPGRNVYAEASVTF